MEKTGIMLVNTGSPAQPTPESVREYLAGFLMDPRLVSMPRPLWWYILHVHILPKRASASAAKYRKIWTDEGSPLVIAHERMVAGLARRYAGRGVPVAGAMCYAPPTVQDVLASLREQGCTRIVYVPLYPQSAYTQVGSCADVLEKACRALGWHPPIELIADYWDDELYLDAVVESIEAAGFDARSDYLDLSLHAIPLRDVKNGDTYVECVQKTNALIARRLGVPDGRWATGYQSVFGRRPQEWTAPLSADIMREWGEAGVRSVFFCCPGFAADCLETLYDIPYEIEPVFREAYRVAHPDAPEPSFTYVPCLDAHEVYPRILHHVLEERSEFLRA